MNVSFIGLGIMGAPMAMHLLTAGLLYKVNNRSMDKTNPFAERGVHVAETPAEAAEGADVIITMVSDSTDVEQVILGTDGVIHKARNKAIIIDMSSINPEVSKQIGAKLTSRDIGLLDAPVSGGEQGAINGTLSIMVGGDAQAMEQVLPILEIMGGSIVHVGPLGSGGYAKLANQIIVGVQLQALSEAFALAKKADLDLDKLYKAIRGGLAGSNLLDNKVDHFISESYTPGFKTHLHLKDLNNALQAAESMGVELQVTKDVQQKLHDMDHAGWGELDHSALYRYMLEQGEI